MKPIPNTDDPVVLRADFTDQAAWEAICTAIREPQEYFVFQMEFLNDTDYSGITKDQLLALIPKNYNHFIIMVVDQTAISQADHPILVVEVFEGSGNEFRAIPSEIQGIENNLSIGNMSFYEFADQVGEDGVFRGFSND
jgi:hypothetical protein